MIPKYAEQTTEQRTALAFDPSPADAPAEDYTFDAEDVAVQIRERERTKDALIDNLNFQIRELRKLLWMLYTGEK